MNILLLLLLLLTSIWVLANLHHPVPFLVVLLSTGAFLLIGPSLFLLAPLLLLSGLMLLFGSGELRRRIVSSRLMKQFRRVIPPMSRTEREALNAGTVWWDADLFSGRPDWEKLLSIPGSRLSEREQAFLDGPTEQLCRMLDDWTITHEMQDLPDDVWQFMKQAGFFGMIIPERYGGLEFSALAHSNVVMKLASRSVAAAVTVMVPNSLGPAKLLLRYGTREQKDYYLPRLAKGTEIPCFALTGPEAGSDAGAIPDRGRVCYQEYQGRRTLGILLNWEKRYITLGPVATLIGLAFRLEDPDQLIGDEPSPGITVALIPRDTPGIRIGKRHIPLDIPFQNGPNSGHDVFIPIGWVIGGREGVGQGWRMLVESLSEGRGISLPALATGAGKSACRYTGSYARIRRQFHQPIGWFEGVEEALARIGALTYQMDAARLLTLQALDSGESPSVVSAIVKYHLTERYRQVINDAMDVQGGSGICLGPNNLIGRIYQAIPISITVEGANILTRSMIIFGQGALRCHPFILAEMEAAHDPDPVSALRRFDQALFRHIGFILRNAARTLLLGLSRSRLSKAPVKGPTAHYFRQLNWMSSAFALCADAAMITLGGALKRKERLSARLGDVLSELYLSSAVLKQYQDQGAPAGDLPLVQWSCEQSMYQMQEALRSLLRNLPYPPLAWLLRLLVFPTGMPYSPPCDHTGHAVARTLLTPSEVRDRLTSGIFITRDPATRVGQLELALDQVERATLIEGTLRGAIRSGLIERGSSDQVLEQATAQGIISTQERRALESMGQLRRQVVSVDAFDDYGEQRSRRPADGDESGSSFTRIRRQRLQTGG
jgi:acyl-CoA dehydrogenase